MKPMRHLAVPDCPSFVVKVETNSGKCEQFPEMRIERLLATGRFRRFLRARRSDGTWRWVKPEVGENDELTRGSILESCVALAPKSERDVRRFNEALEAAREEQSGEKAFEFYEQYKAQKLVVDGEDAAKKFLDIAVAKRWPVAIACADAVRAKNEESHCDTEKLLSRLKKDKVANPDLIVKFIEKAKGLKITASRCGEFASMYTEDLLSLWIARLKKKEDIHGAKCESISAFTEKLFLIADTCFGSNYHSSVIRSIYNLFWDCDPSRLSATDVEFLVMFFLSHPRYWSKSGDRVPFSSVADRDARILGMVCYDELN